MLSEREILNKAIEKWGPVKQVNKAVEECSELITALMRPDSRRSINNIAEEIVDVRIMLDQVEMIFGISNIVKRFREEKIERLEKRL